MGSIYFSDFLVFHQALGIDRMVSIEREIEHRKRFEFNRPYACVDIIFDEVSNVLDSIEWDSRCLVWLDYDGKLELSVIADLRQLVQNASSGSLISISVNVEADRPPSNIINVKEQDEWRLNEFEQKVGENLLPVGLSGADLRGKLYGKQCWEVLNSTVIDQLVKRNGRPGERPDSILSKQVFHFRYSDGVPMLTVGWLLYSSADSPKAEQCNMTGGIFRSDSTPFSIEAPKLTPKEIRHLNAHLPSGLPVSRATIKKITLDTGISEADIQKFAAVYRHYPQYCEVAL